MNILIACEQSQVVCAAFRRAGFEAYSSDIGAQTFAGIAEAMAAQWGGVILKDCIK